MTLLLTGASGCVGSHFLEHFLTNTDWDIICIASWKHKGTPERIEEVLKGNPLWKERVEIITHDLIAPLTLMTRERIGQVDYIVNCASESHVDRSIADPVPFVKNNTDLILTMLELARHQDKLKAFVQISTDEVYGVAPDKIRHKEWETILPSNPYSASKACQEAIAISYWRTYGIPLIITNTMNNFGEMQDPEKYMAKIIRYIDSGIVVPVHGSVGNIGSRYYLHARNHADAVLFLLKKISPVRYEEHSIYPSRYNIVGDIELDNLEVAERIAKIMGKKLNYKLTDFHSTRPGHDRRYALDGSKIKSLGWKAPLDFDSSLEKYVRWTLKNPTWL